ncbi:hypothetical protein TIFTF001_027906 [Ficus carica]|uniref:Uncharacterized protein n=1 Tax=Ficus carica TaxID=3494 RepID=A0AA88DNX2_FICCA|nr:hypothetical protein TIFTF001_027906 [Ficus carica]
MAARPSRPGESTPARLCGAGSAVSPSRFDGRAAGRAAARLCGTAALPSRSDGWAARRAPAWPQACVARLRRSLGPHGPFDLLSPRGPLDSIVSFDLMSN